MASKSKSEFAHACGISSNALSVYIGRGQVILESNGLIDDENGINMAFLVKRMAKASKSIPPIPKPPKQPKPPKKSVGRPSKEQKKIEAKVKAAPVKPEMTVEEKAEAVKKKQDFAELADMERRAKQAKLDRETEELELIRMKRAKAVGDVVPTGVIKTLIVHFSESIKNHYTEACENLLVIIAQTKGFSSEEMGKIRSQLIVLVNRAVDGSLDSTKKNLSSIVDDYSKRRGVGQHD